MAHICFEAKCVPYSDRDIGSATHSLIRNLLFATSVYAKPVYTSLYLYQLCSLAQTALLLGVSLQYTYAKSSFASCSAVILLGLPHQLLLILFCKTDIVFSSLTSLIVLLYTSCTLN